MARTPAPATTVHIDVRFRFHLSLREALTLRLAGKEIRQLLVREFAERMAAAVEDGSETG